MPLDVDAMPRHPAAGRHVLGSSRTNPFKIDGGVERLPGHRSSGSASTR